MPNNCPNSGIFSSIVIKVSLISEGVVWSKANNCMVSIALCDRTVLGSCWMTSSIKLRIVHLGQFSSPGTMKLIGMNLWHFETEYLQCFFIQNFSNLNYRPSSPKKNMLINVICTSGKSVPVPVVPKCRNPSFIIGYTLYQSVEIAVLPCINDAAHDENIKTTNTVRCKIA